MDNPTTPPQPYHYSDMTQQLAELAHVDARVNSAIGGMGKGLQDMVSRLGAPVSSAIESAGTGIGGIESALGERAVSALKSQRRKLSGMHRRLQTPAIKQIQTTQAGAAAILSRLPRGQLSQPTSLPVFSAPYSDYRSLGRQPGSAPGTATRIPPRVGAPQVDGADGAANGCSPTYITYPSGTFTPVSIAGGATPAFCLVPGKGYGQYDANTDSCLFTVPPDPSKCPPPGSVLTPPGAIQPAGGGGWYCIVDAEGQAITTSQDPTEATNYGGTALGPYPDSASASAACLASLLPGGGPPTVPSPPTAPPIGIAPPIPPSPVPPPIMPPAPPTPEPIPAPAPDAGLCECITYLADRLCQCIKECCPAVAHPSNTTGQDETPEWIPPPIPADDFEELEEDKYTVYETPAGLAPFTAEPGAAVGGSTVGIYVPGD